MTEGKPSPIIQVIFRFTLVFLVIGTKDISGDCCIS